MLDLTPVILRFADVAHVGPNPTLRHFGPEKNDGWLGWYPVLAYNGAHSVVGYNGRFCPSYNRGRFTVIMLFLDTSRL